LFTFRGCIGNLRLAFSRGKYYLSVFVVKMRNER
jgi:hypothetical protein